jgi:hypothetical protein
MHTRARDPWIFGQDTAGMPGRGTRQRGFRIPDDLYEAARRIAELRGDELSEIVRRALRAYVRRHEPKPTNEDH